MVERQKDRQTDGRWVVLACLSTRRVDWTWGDQRWRYPLRVIIKVEQGTVQLTYDIIPSILLCGGLLSHQ